MLAKTVEFRFIWKVSQRYTVVSQTEVDGNMLVLCIIFGFKYITDCQQSLTVKSGFVQNKIVQVCVSTVERFYGFVFSQLTDNVRGKRCLPDL